jgi:opacity protein-like surface antigen
MANAYADLGEFYGITPYIGAGIGVSRNTIHDFRDINVPTGGVAYGGTRSGWELAWALHAGVGIKATDRLTVDLGYSYVHLGDAGTNRVVAYDGSGSVAPFTLKDIASHDFKLGVRYSLH